METCFKENIFTWAIIWVCILNGKKRYEKDILKYQKERKEYLSKLEEVKYINKINELLEVGETHSAFLHLLSLLKENCEIFSDDSEKRYKVGMAEKYFFENTKGYFSNFHYSNDEVLTYFKFEEYYSYPYEVDYEPRPILKG